MIWKFTDNKSRDSIEQQFDWARNMNEVPQDKLYHAEGNVAVHTWKVIEELQQLPAYSDLGGQDKEILWTAALLHDVEKRSATVVESDGRITARGHARKGEYTVRTLLYRDLPTPFAIREKIASLVDGKDRSCAQDCRSCFQAGYFAAPDACRSGYKRSYLSR